MARRVGLAVVAYTCLLAQVASFAHRVLVQHVTCAEHGEAIHVGASSHSRESADMATAHSLSSDARLPRAAGAPAIVADDHDHCSAVLSPSGAVSSPARQAVGVAAPFLRITIPSPRLAGAAVETYLIAPKTSPPVGPARA